MKDDRKKQLKEIEKMRKYREKLIENFEEAFQLLQESNIKIVYHYGKQITYLTETKGFHYCNY